MENKVVQNSADNEKNIKLYSVLAYIGILWIVGLLVKEKNNKDLKFHVGQGMLITILSIIINIVNNVVIYNIFTTTQYLFGTTVRVASPTGRMIGGLLNIVPIVFMIIGIVAAANNNKKELPIIGKYAFYK